MTGVYITALATLALLVCEWRGWLTGKAFSKPLASIGFLWAAVDFGAVGSSYGRALLSGFGLSLAGDVLLLWHEPGVFRVGILAFLGAHVAYLVAFFLRGVAFDSAGLAIAPLAVAGFAVGVPLLRRVQKPLKPAVATYMLVISLMVAAACGTRAPWVIAGAVAFYLSDLSVARDRFVAPGFLNRLWGLPLYYGAQLILAWTCAGLGPS